MLREQVVTARANGSFPPVSTEEREKVKVLSDAVGNIIRAETLNRNRLDQVGFKCGRMTDDTMCGAAIESVREPTCRAY